MKRAFLIVAALLLALPADAQFNVPALMKGRAAGGGGDVLLTAATVIEPSGNSQSHLTFTIAEHFGTTAGSLWMDGSHRVKVIDSDTGAEIPVQEDNRATDVGGNIRKGSLTFVTDAATANEVKSVTLYRTSGAPVTGTDITISDINAYFSGGCGGACAASYDMPVVFQNLNGSGNDYTASLNTGLTSGHTGWINKTTPTVMGTYRSGGGLLTEYIVYVPATHSGTPDAQLYVKFDVACYKNGRGAVGGGNPIQFCWVTPLISNGWAQQNTGVDDWFGLSIGTGGSVISLPNTTPAITLTVSQSTAGNNLPTHASAPFFSLNRQGQLISDGVGVAVVDGYSGSTQDATIAIHTPFSNTTITGYTLFGTQLPFGSEIGTQYRTQVGGARAQPDPYKGQVYLGPAWNNGTLTGGPSAYLIATGAIFNYNFAPSVYNSTQDLAALTAMGTNPNGYGNSQNGLSPLYLETTGGRADLGVIPDYNAGPLVRWDANAASIIFGQAHRWNTFPYHYMDQTTGKNLSPCNAGSLPACSGSLIYTLDNRFISDHLVPTPVNSIQEWIGDGFAHDPASYFGAWVLTDDYPWVDGQQAAATYAWMQPNAGTPGSGFQKTLFVPMNVCCGLQGRGTAWAQNAIFLMRQFTPDSSSVLGWSKGMVSQYFTNTFVGTQSWLTSYFNNQDAGGNFYTANGPHWLADLISFPPWQQSFAFVSLAHAREAGLLDSNGMLEFNWFASNAVLVATDPTVQGQWLSTGYYGVVHSGNTPACPMPYSDSWTYVNTWQDYYQSNALIHPDAAVLFEPRAMASTATLSGTSGANVTVSLFNDGTRPFATRAFYPNGWVGSNDGGRGQIKTVVDDYTVVIDTTVTKAYANSQDGCRLYSGHAFGATTYSGGFYHIPNPAPADFLGTNWTSNAGGFDFTDLMQVSAGFAKQWGMANGATAYATMLGYTGGVPKAFYKVKWAFGVRTTPP